ncbi:MAG: TIGR02186 family protein [Reyranella sp.]|uniref:TIGR02186 family protein n=1 Tax=Reyranella sp. TaxID=1929291 RepID=UPI001AC96CAC|nr:TIGR02186 family protein [Reyranella sp.]MBN9538294.1 TIGR02186 family protein [Alphaproteobacteria bacterium]MBR2817673.1 TIGR02186 family protein [Reyranella sp.]
MRRLAALLVLLASLPLAAASQAVAQRVEPPAGALPPNLGGPPDSNAPPSVPSESTTPELIVDLSLARVSITSAFQGESILMFGMFDPPGEIVVVVQGPAARETVMRKQRVLGLWLNTGRQSFDDVPAYYAIAASQPLQRLLARGAGGEILSLEDRLSTIKPATPRDAAELAKYRAGLVEVKRQEGLYPAAIGQVTVQAGRLFRVDLPFPSRLPEGVYEVKAYLLRDGRIVAAVSRPLPVGKVGFSAQLAGWADHEGPLYGVGAILMALVVGWLGGAIVRRL